MTHKKTQELKQALSHVLWIGGATDAGKTTVARILAARHNLQLYHYDRHDLPHHERLAQSHEEYRAFLAASLHERWVVPDPEALLQRSLRSFRDRFPLVVAELRALPAATPMVAEGFGLTPALVAPLLSGRHQAIWLVPTESFKRASMQRRNKPSFAAVTGDPERARNNLLRRDLLLAQLVQAQAHEHDLVVVEVDGTKGAREVAAVLERHFAPYLFREERQSNRFSGGRS